jgi:hypothetical protein
VPEGIKNCIDYSCFEITPCAERDSCVRDSFGPVCADSAEDCEKVRDGYNWTIASQNLMGGVVRSGEPGLPPGYDLQCHAEDGCTLMPGHCDSGLDTCWLVMPPYMKPELDRLAALYERLGCPPLSDCSCTPMPSEFVCAFEPDRQLGRCVGN